MLAAAMWNQPHLLVLDEPTNDLDRDAFGAQMGDVDSVAKFEDVWRLAGGATSIWDGTCLLPNSLDNTVSTTPSDSQPYMCVRLCGFPYCSTKWGIMASRTRGSIGVVACMSR